MIDMLLLFLFFLSIFTILRYGILFLQHLFSNPPKKLVLSDIKMVELIASCSYFFTYILT